MELIAVVLLGLTLLFSGAFASMPVNSFSPMPELPYIPLEARTSRDYNNELAIFIVVVSTLLLLDLDVRLFRILLFPITGMIDDIKSTSYQLLRYTFFPRVLFFFSFCSCLFFSFPFYWFLEDVCVSIRYFELKNQSGAFPSFYCVKKIPFFIDIFGAILMILIYLSCLVGLYFIFNEFAFRVIYRYQDFQVVRYVLSWYQSVLVDITLTSFAFASALHDWFPLARFKYAFKIIYYGSCFIMGWIFNHSIYAFLSTAKDITYEYVGLSPVLFSSYSIPAAIFDYLLREPVEFRIYMNIPTYEFVPLMPPRYTVPRERRHDVKKFSISKVTNFVTRDYDFDNNCRSYSLGADRDVKFYGKTILDGRTYSFPSHGCRRSFITFVLWMERNVDYNDRARFIIEGICTPKILSGYRLIYAPLKAERQFAESTFSGLSPDLVNVEWACLAIGVAFHSYNKDVRSLAILLGSHASLAPKITAMFGVTSLPDLVTLLTDIFRKKDDRSLIMEQCTLDNDLKLWFAADSDDEEANELSESQIVALSPMAVLSLFPEAIKRSPLITKLVTLVTVIACASFSSTGSYVPSILKTMDWTQITERVFCAALLSQVLMMVWKGMVAFSESGTYMDLLGVPAETKFIRESSALLYEVDKPLTTQEVRINIAKAAELIKSRDYLVGANHVIDRTIVDLRKYIKSKLEFLTALEPRIEPVIIFLKGEPGSGKTTLINALRNYLNSKDGVKAFPGEFISYNLYDKFPVETGAHSSARFLILNDVANDYTDFPQRDLKPLDILLQEAIDTATLTFRSAAVEDKGKVFNSIKYVILTTNHDKYKFSTDSTKLIRRFQSGVFVTIDFKKGDFGANKILNDVERNASIIIRPMSFNINLKYMHLLPADGIMSYSRFFSHVGDKTTSHFEYANSQFLKLFAPNSLCPCGVPKLMHFEDIDYISHEITVDTPPIRPTWSRINDSCIPPFEEESGVVALSPVALFVSGSLFAMSIPYLVSCFDTFKTFYSAVRRYGFEVAVSAYVIGSRCNNEFLRMMGKRSKAVAACYEVEYKAIEFMVALHKFVQKYAKPIAIFFGTAFIGSFMYSYFKEKPKDVTLGGGMSRFTVDEASMMTSVAGKIQTYEPSTMRTWARTAPIQHHELISKGVGYEDLVRLCKNAMCSALFVIRRDGAFKSFSPRVVFLSPDYVGVNKHYFQDDDGTLWPQVEITIDKIQRIIDTKDLIPIADSEMVLIRNDWRPSTPNIMKKFANFDVNPGTPYDLMVLYEDRGNLPMPAFGGEIPLYGVNYPCMLWPEEGHWGDCGTLTLSQIGGSWFISGMIAFGKSLKGKIISVGITTVQFKNFPTEVALGYPAVEEFVVAGLPRNLVPLSNNSEFAQSPNKYLTPYGSTLGGNNHFKSEFKKTKLYDEVSPKFSEPFNFPDRISRTVTLEDGTREYRSAWRSTFKHVDLDNLSTHGLRIEAMESYVEDCLIPVKGKKVELHPLSLFEAFWGHESLKVDGVVMKTSLGTTWREQGFRDKHDLFTKNEVSGKFEAIPQFVASVQTLIDNLEKGVLQAPLVDFVPKDEVRPQTKIDSCKIRLFSVLDFDINAVFRMFCMPIINYLLDNPEFSECYGAMNAGSIQWTKLAQRLKKHSFYTDLDFSSFDTSHDLVFILLVALFFYRISRRLGYTEQEARLTFLIIRSLTFQLLKYLCDYFGKTKGMPSGVIITLILNSIINSVLMRMAFRVVCPSIPLSEFRNKVSAATTGDDNVSGISEEIIDSFNPIVLKPLYESWGYVITPATKGNEFQKSINFEDLVFLKRKFVLWVDGWYRAPLDKDSLYKALAFQGSSSLSMSARLISVYDSMVREAYLHGEVFFNEYYSWIRELFIKHRLAAPPGEEVLPGMAKHYHFEDLDKIFKDGAFATFMC